VGEHQDGICALRMKLLHSPDNNNFVTAEYNFIPDGKQFALSLSNAFLDAVLPPIADAYPKPEEPPRDRCSEENLIDYLKITKLDLTIPSGQNLKFFACTEQSRETLTNCRVKRTGLTLAKVHIINTKTISLCISLLQIF